MVHENTSVQPLFSCLLFDLLASQQLDSRINIHNGGSSMNLCWCYVSQGVSCILGFHYLFHRLRYQCCYLCDCCCHRNDCRRHRCSAYTLLSSPLNLIRICYHRYLWRFSTLFTTFYAVAALVDAGALEAEHIIVGEVFSAAAARGPLAQLAHTNVAAVGGALAIICTEDVLHCISRHKG